MLKVSVDKFTRTLGLYRLAESSVAALSPETQSLLQAYADGGPAGAKAFLEQCIQEIRVAFLLTGSKDLPTFQQQPIVVGQQLERWIPKSSKITTRFWHNQ